MKDKIEELQKLLGIRISELKMLNNSYTSALEKNGVNDATNEIIKCIKEKNSEIELICKNIEDAKKKEEKIVEYEVTCSSTTCSSNAEADYMTSYYGESKNRIYANKFKLNIPFTLINQDIVESVEFLPENVLVINLYDCILVNKEKLENGDFKVGLLEYLTSSAFNTFLSVVCIDRYHPYGCILCERYNDVKLVEISRSPLYKSANGEKCFVSIKLKYSGAEYF